MRYHALIYLVVILVVLKLTGLVSMSWWVVTCPIWVPFLLAFIFSLMVLALALAWAVFLEIFLFCSEY